MSIFLYGKTIHRSTTNPAKDEENFLKEFSRDFHQKILDIDDFDTFEITLSKWIKNINSDTKKILGLMKNHKGKEFLFSSIIGFFYQHGIGCDVDKNKAL